ncbi:MAG: AsmA family protein [Porticoccaceae bacterium]|nr:AsmA family protein [Porticoccaceae bacterium]
MNKLLKAMIGSLLIIILLVAAVVTYVVVAIDPNDYKAQIQKAASEQGIDLKISGDLSWQIIPSLAIRIGETSMSSSTQVIPNTRFNNASLSLQWAPLLKQQIKVSAITIDGADIHITNNEEAAATAAAPVAASGESSSADSAFGIAVDSVKITNSRISLPGESPDQPMILDKLFFEGKKINLEGKSFPITLSFDYSDGGLPQATSITLDSDMSVNLAGDELIIKGLNISSSGLSLSLDATVTQMSTAPQASGSLHLPSTDLKAVLNNFGIALPDMPDKNALTSFSLSADFSGSEEEVQIQSLEIKLDGTTITGKASAKLNKPKQLSATFTGDSIDLNRYVASSEADDSSTDNSAQQSQAELIFAPLIAPLVFLDGGNSKLEFNWGKLQTDGLSIDTIHVASTSKGYNLNISDFSANTLGGNIKSTGRLGNLKGKKPKLNYTAQLNNISLAEATKAFTEGLNASGTLTASVKGESRGATGDQIFNNLKSDGTLQIVEPELKTINIEQSYCQVAAMVEKIPAKDDWPAGTKLNTVDGKFRMQGQTLLLDGLSSGVGNLTLNANGEVDLEAGAFNILAVTRLNGDRTSENGCLIESTKLRDKDIPLRCKDSFENAGAKSCRPDGDFVKQFAKDKILEKIGEKTGLSEEDSKAVDSLLKGLFGR